MRSISHEGSCEPVYKASQLLALLGKQTNIGHSPTLLASDIDNTFVNESLQDSRASHELMDYLTTERIPVMYVTGNSLDSVHERIAAGILPAPALIAPCVGTQLWVRQGETNHYAVDETFAAQLKATGYNRREVVLAAQAWLHERTATAPMFGACFQNEDAENAFLTHGSVIDHQEYKVSFHFFAESPDQVAELKACAETWFGFTVLTCEEISYNSTLSAHARRKKYCLDIVPVTKAYVVEYVRERFAINATIVAGDSGNDLHMLTESGDISIVVGGAQPSLRDAVDVLLHNAPQHNGFAAHGKAADRTLYYRESGDRIGPESILHALLLWAGSSNGAV